MKMRLFCIILCLGCIFCGCSQTTEQETENAANEKEYVMPYVFSEEEQHLLELFSLENEAGVLTFSPPEKAKWVTVQIHELDENGLWKQVHRGGCSLEKQMGEEYTMAFRKDTVFGIKYRLEGGNFDFQSETMLSEESISWQSMMMLEKGQKIEIGKEIPVAMMLYAEDGTKKGIYGTETYFTPEELQNLSLAQAMTLRFDDVYPSE